MLKNERITAALDDYEVLFRESDVIVYIRTGAMRQKPAETRG
jgi:hypothetical protein